MESTDMQKSKILYIILPTIIVMLANHESFPIHIRISTGSHTPLSHRPGERQKFAWGWVPATAVYMGTTTC